MSLLQKWSGKLKKFRITNVVRFMNNGPHNTFSILFVFKIICLDYVYILLFYYRYTYTKLERATD